MHKCVTNISLGGMVYRMFLPFYSTIVCENIFDFVHFCRGLCSDWKWIRKILLMVISRYFGDEFSSNCIQFQNFQCISVQRSAKRCINVINIENTVHRRAQLYKDISHRATLSIHISSEPTTTMLSSCSGSRNDDYFWYRGSYQHQHTDGLHFLQ